MKPGFELDNLIALHIFGITSTNGWVDTKAMIAANGGRDYIPKYSQEIAAAWEVVEKMKYESFRLTHWTNNPRQGWECEFNGYLIKANTAPHAICLAALKAKGVEI
jgi:hypothetical protein